MPTGYTDKIKDGISFPEFALNCARAFGACVTLRDDPQEPIPEVFEATNWHLERIKEAEAELKCFESIGPQEALRAMNEEVSKQIEYHRDGIEKDRKLKESYEAMLAKVNDWVPPTQDHYGMKEFMQQQIRDSINFDCMGTYHEEAILRLEAMTVDKWIEDKIESAKWTIVYNTEQHEKEVVRTNDRTEWIRDLRKNLETLS